MYPENWEDVLWEAIKWKPPNWGVPSIQRWSAPYKHVKSGAAHLTKHLCLLSITKEQLGWCRPSAKNWPRGAASVQGEATGDTLSIDKGQGTMVVCAKPTALGLARTCRLFSLEASRLPSWKSARRERQPWFLELWNVTDFHKATATAHFWCSVLLLSPQTGKAVSLLEWFILQDALC